MGRRGGAPAPRLGLQREKERVDGAREPGELFNGEKRLRNRPGFTIPLGALEGPLREATRMTPKAIL